MFNLLQKLGNHLQFIYGISIYVHYGLVNLQWVGLFTVLVVFFSYLESGLVYRVGLSNVCMLFFILSQEMGNHLDSLSTVGVGLSTVLVGLSAV